MKTSGTEKRNLQSKNDLEHLKLIDMACRHIALAAISTVFGVSLFFDAENLDSNFNEVKYELKTELDLDDKDVEDFDDDNDSQSNFSSDSEDVEDFGIINKGSYYIQHLRLKSKKRRGGVLGFKELAAKSQLSPWHFHRVFKSMTGITPKQYGDKCFKFLDSKKSSTLQSLTCPTAIIMNVRLANPSMVFKRNAYIQHSSTECFKKSKSSQKLTSSQVESTNSKDYSYTSPLRSVSYKSESPTSNPKSNNQTEFNSCYSSPYDKSSNLINYSASNNIQSSAFDYNPNFSPLTSPLDLEFIKLANNSLTSEYIPETNQTGIAKQLSNLLDTCDLPSTYHVYQNDANTPKNLTALIPAKSVSNNSNISYNIDSTARYATNDHSYQTPTTSNSAYFPEYPHINEKFEPLNFDFNQRSNDPSSSSSSSDINILIHQLQLQSMLDKNAEQRFSALFEDEGDSFTWNNIDFKDIMNGYN
ncbi:hypothetical protein CANINC_004217 [Pichia inconspicua]|uniref:HTH araC/xylS-type domain-containing protein n=1 Tax=Pichia inconspicua TaxID=52247 RepID=A0A4T0WWR5_9ASCO|nr:hypothetical protein CANINC_004217 [[Candida] inconspicua]